MMIETMIFLAAALAPVQSVPDATGCGQAASQAAPSIDPAIIEMTYNAFVAVEETPGLSDLARPAIVSAPDGQSAIPAPRGTGWIS